MRGREGRKGGFLGVSPIHPLLGFRVTGISNGLAGYHRRHGPGAESSLGRTSWASTGVLIQLALDGIQASARDSDGICHANESTVGTPAFQARKRRANAWGLGRLASSDEATRASVDHPSGSMSVTRACRMW